MTARIAKTLRRPRGRPLVAESRRTREDLLVCAERLFGRHGYGVTTIDELARANKVAISAVYHHFGSKAALFVAAAADSSGAALGRLEAAVESSTDFRGRLRALVRSAASLHEEPERALFAVNLELEARRHPELRPGIVALLEPFLKLYDRVAADAVANGEAPSGLNREALSRLVRSIVVGVARSSDLEGGQVARNLLIRAYDALIGSATAFAPRR